MCTIYYGTNNAAKVNYIEYYSKLAEKYGGEIIGYYKNAMEIIINEKSVIEIMDNEINSERFIITKEPHEKRVEGFPLNSLSKEIKSGKYYFDIGKEKYNENIREEYKRIFKKVIEKINTP